MKRQDRCLARRVGVIMLDTRFPRPPGDIGNPLTFGGHGLFEVVPGATVSAATGPGGGRFLSVFLQARNRLIERGAEIITTSCGFLVRHQQALQDGCPVPVVTSSLLQIPDRARELGPGRRVGVMALDRSGLDAAMLAAAGAPASVALAGVERGTELLRVLKADDPALGLDVEAAERDVIASGEELLRGSDDIGAIVLECTNLPPYRAALAEHTGLPVYDILTLLEDVLAQPAIAKRWSGAPVSA